MGYEIYVNYLSSLEAHIGILRRESAVGRVLDMDYQRPIAPRNESLLACISVFADDGKIPGAATIDRILDEGFQKLVKFDNKVLYTETVGSGTFQFMCRPGFPHDAATAKAAIHEVIARLGSPGKAVLPYVGKPSKLFRYGKRSHLEGALKLGKFRINPATLYGDLTDDKGRQDDELNKVFERDPSTLTIKTAAGVVLKPKGLVKFANRRAGDYYVLCLSAEYSAEVANEFKGSEACLVIRDSNDFAERLHAALEHARPRYTGMEALVTYGQKSPLGVCFTKTIGYAGQSEFRFAWTTMDDSLLVPKLDPFFLEMGSIEDIAEVIHLPS